MSNKKLHIISIGLVLMGGIGLLGCSGSIQTEMRTEQEINCSFKNPDGRDLFISLLEEPLWRSRDAYDAGHYLMIPLHYAELCDDRDLLEAFQAHFEGLLKVYDENDIDLKTGQELQYLTLVSRWVSLDTTVSSPEEKQDLADLVEARFLHYWEQAPAWQWTQNDFDGGVRERLEWKLTIEDVDRSYYNAIIDQELFLMGIAADLLVWHQSQGSTCESCVEAIEYFDRIMEARLHRGGPGWDFQLGMRTDHYTYQYAGYLTKPDEDSPPKPVEGLQQDSSHAHRWPLWLTQLASVRDVCEFQERLKWQLINQVVETQSGVGIPVLRNYMSGHNGYYRWQYETHEENEGYGPYELSGTFSMGWWAFLGGKEVSDLYIQLEKAYPLDEAQLALYEGLSTRERHPIIESAYVNGLKKGLSQMAVVIAQKWQKHEGRKCIVR